MSADSPKRSAVRCVPAVVPPQVVSDRSLIDSVAGFINDVTLTSPPQGDPKDQVLWVRFENMADISDPTCGEDWELEGNVPPPLVIILGFGSGIKVYALPAHGEAVEILGWRHGMVKALRILPTPITVDDEMANEPIDQFIDQRPLMALCDSSSTACSSQYCSVSFISLKNGAQVKMIKFKNPVIDILANRTSIVVTFQERIAVFDARNLEDRLSISTCHPSPGINPNPVALGARWMAYSEWKLMPSKRSSGGCDCEGVPSYTATVLNAAKSLGKGLRELGEQVAAGLTGSGSNGGSLGSSKSSSFESSSGELKQPGLVTIVDIKYPIKETSPTTGSPVTATGTDPTIAHFIAHFDAIVALEFDPSGMLLLTADKRGHNFHVFRVQPHPAGPHLAAVHHLYILHRGDTSAKIQHIAFSLDSRWVAVSSLRGTTHVFPITPYGGPAGVRTHGSLHVVNRLSRFHRSAGLTVDGRSSSPISHTESACNQSCTPFNNPRTSPFPRPVAMHALAQIRQPSALGTPPGSAQNSYTRTGSGRQRLSSLSDDAGKDIRVCAVFAKARSWLLDPPNAARETPSHRMQKKAVDSLFIMAGHGALIQYDLEVKLVSNVAKEKICDDTAIELEVEAKAQWYLGRRENTPDIQPPLPRENWLMRDPSYQSLDNEPNSKDTDDQNERWLSQVEIITHAGPHRRLWMGPQFIFKTYNTPSGAPLSHIDTEAVEIGINAMNNRPGRSSPMNMPMSSKGGVPVLIESGSYSSFEQSPKLMDRFRHGHMESDFSFTQGDSRLKEDLADAMKESPSPSQRDSGLTPVSKSSSPQPTSTTTLQFDRATASSIDVQRKSPLSTEVTKQKPSPSQILIEKVVNPLGTVTTITRSPSENDFDSTNSNDFGDDYIIHENCDEALFRPVVAIFCDDSKAGSEAMLDSAYIKPPEAVGTELIVPVIEEKQKAPPSVVRKTVSKEAEKSGNNGKVEPERSKEQESCDPQIAKFTEMSLINRKTAKAPKRSNKEKESSPPAPSVKKEHLLESTTATTAKPPSKQDKLKKEKLVPEQSTKSEQPAKTQLPEAKSYENTQSIKSGTQSANVSTKGNLPVSQSKTKDNSDTTNGKKKTVAESSKCVETAANPTTKKEHSFDAASSFESIINASKKVIEKAEKVLVPSKKTEKTALKSSKKESVEENTPCVDSKSCDIKPSMVEEVDPLSRPDESMDCTQSVPEAPHSPELKAKNANTKSKKAKDKPLAVLQDVQKVKPMESEASDTGLKFYEKFSESEIRNIEIENFPPLQKVQLKDLEYPSLSASLSETRSGGKKSKGLNSSPKQSPQKTKKELSSEKRDTPIEVEISDTVTLPFSPKKKSKKSSVEEVQAVFTISNIGDCDTKAASFNIERTTTNKDAAKEISEGSIVSPARSLKSKKAKDISSQLSFELIPAPDYTEPVLPPLESFEPPKFDELYYETQHEAVSLINFESPVTEEQSEKNIEKAADKEETVPACGKSKDECSSPRHKYTKQNLILALCGSIHESDGKTSGKCEPSGFSEPVNDIDEQYLSLEPMTYQENTPWTSSSEDTEESSRNVIKKHSRSRHHANDELVRRDDDEELRPLIDATHSACSMTSSSGVAACMVGSGKQQVSTEDEETSTIALEIAKAISDSLPETNSHSDSSDQGNALQSSEDLDYDMPSTPPLNDDGCSAGTKKSSKNCNSSVGSGGLSSSNQQTAANGKKKSKRKKR
ncbi:unnamed protein product [Hermetia illucens]|uniref:Breast carcinoma amplified sequence 3 n=1 Tax=Hermetia illucens TaxID=343691 RepID=A0A7R8V247_HERIL|nr:uncharacterized protein LOC119657759 isoform X2 [Hermetia illucens]CAD7090787.1 unnamed protein product [Hermetia illucens]